MKGLLIISIVTSLVTGQMSSQDSVRIRNDKTLIGPGLGAENVLLNQSADDILSIKGYPDKISELNEKKDLFAEVLKVKAPVKIIFDKIFYYTYQKTAFFLNSNTVCAITGLNSQKITIDSVDLNKGAEYFIFNYGNKNLTTLKRNNDSKDVIYFYSNGIAIVDDRGDDKIDMYIVFPADSKQQR
jgi:hypothetical protein